MPKSTPAIRRANKQVNAALEKLREQDLTLLISCLESLHLNPEQAASLKKLCHALQRLEEAEQARDAGGEQSDMFEHLSKDAFLAWKHPLNQPTLF